jgi:DNA-binding NtrC family response regulator
LEVKIVVDGSAIGTVLCVDDDVAGLELRKEMLEMHGYRVLTALSAKEALEVFDHEEIDVVLTDHLLRGQTGTSLAAQMKRRRPDVAVAVYSGVAQSPDDIYKADAFITKLVTPEELIAYLERTIATKNAGRNAAKKLNKKHARQSSA